MTTTENLPKVFAPKGYVSPGEDATLKGRFRQFLYGPDSTGMFRRDELKRMNQDFSPDAEMLAKALLRKTGRMVIITVDDSSIILSSDEDEGDREALDASRTSDDDELEQEATLESGSKAGPQGNRR